MERSASATPQALDYQSHNHGDNEGSHTKKPKSLLLSPYFCHNPPKHRTHAKRLVLSPYFLNHVSRSQQLHTLEIDHVHALPPGYFHDKNGTKLAFREKSKTTFQNFHTQTPNTSSSSERERKRKMNREKKKEDVVVSPYFQNKNNEEAEASASASNSVRQRETETKGGRDIKGSSSSNFNKFLEAYRRKSGDNMWIPPKSIYGLLQEKYYEDPWKVLIICMLLNRTRGCQAANVISNLFELCPNAKAATKVETGKIENIITTLGLQKKRSMMIQQFSQDYLSDEWTHVTQLHGIGKYAADAYAIFCTGHWKDVNPDDLKLVPYWEDLWISEKIRLPVI